MLRTRLALVAAIVLVLTAPLAGAGQDVPRAQFVGRYTWTDERKQFGGFSGIDLDRDGQGMVVISDSAYVMRGRLIRDAKGATVGIKSGGLPWLKNSNGKAPRGNDADAEGLALAPGGGFYVSFELNTRIAYFEKPGAPARLLPRPPDFAGMPFNRSLEALAIDADGALWTLPEEHGENTSFPLWRYRNGVWDQPFSIPGGKGFLPVGADFGPDGRFYLLERKVLLFGFQSRVRRFDLGENRLLGCESILTTAPGAFGDLEGLAVWQDQSGTIRLTMIADDNFRSFLRTEIVDYLIR
ncbi:MAG: esterase-like activity of phytase family protein [Paracoccus sp. (in: a-proteobacteria)]